MAVEGEARKELLLKVSSATAGFVSDDTRIASGRSPHPSLTPSSQELLRDWAEKILAGTEEFKEPDRYMPVKIDTSEGRTYSTIKELADHSCPF
jgi:hypothetical protein